MTMRKYLCVLCACLAFCVLCACIGCGKPDVAGEGSYSDTEEVTREQTDADTPAATVADTEAEVGTDPDTDADTGADTGADTDVNTQDDTDEAIGTEGVADTTADTEAEPPADTETETLIPPAHMELEYCHYNYECVKSVNEVVADGVYHEEEWAEAVELVINNDTLEDWGRWQEGPVIDSANLSVTFKMKWDESYFYLLEIRTDTSYVYEFGDKGYDVFSDVWGGDATAFFFCDGVGYFREDRCDIGYFTYVDKLGGPAVYVGSFDGESKAFRGPSGTDGCTYGGTYDDDACVAVFEMKLPWSIMDQQGKLFSDIEEGTLFRFNPIIPSVLSTEDLGMYNERWSQINFHDCVENGEGGNPDDPFYWAALTLVEKASGN